MKEITREHLKEIIRGMNDKNGYLAYAEKCREKGTNPNLCEYHRKIFFSVAELSDRIPANLVETVLSIVARTFYDVSGKGYHGVIDEIITRVRLYSDVDGFVECREFLVHKMGVNDFYDKDNNTPYEHKTGAGDWLYSEIASFDETVKMYTRKRTQIDWDFTDTQYEGKFSFHITTTYKKLFAFLAEYKNKGLTPWFIESSRSGRAGTYIWKMQCFTSSKTKMRYLQSFSEWEKNHK